MRILFALPGLHRVNRGAEVAFEELGRAMSVHPRCQVTLLGSGPARAGESYEYLSARCLPRERFVRWPKMPYLRSHYVYEELSFIPGMLAVYRPQDYDVTVTCGYPYTNWVLRARHSDGYRPRHVYVTQNGDWMVHARMWEYRHFGCDALICTNCEYYQRHSTSWPSALIPNGVDPAVFSPGSGRRRDFGLPADRPVILMVSALIPSKRVLEGIRAVALLPEAHLIIAGDGELRSKVESLGREVLPGRFSCLQLPRAAMPSLYRSADAFLHMSVDEPSANAYIEALATGLPTVTHDRAVTRWTLEETSILVDTADAQAVANGLQAALKASRPCEIEARRNLAVTRFAWKSIAGQYAAFFRAMFGGGHERQVCLKSA